MAAPRPKVQVTFHPEDAAAEEDYQRPQDTERVATTIAPAARWILAALALVILAIVAGAPSVNGKFLPQDDTHVTDNTALRLWKGLIPIWLTPQRMESPNPFTFTSYLLQYKIFGERPTGYHVVSLLLHAAVTLLLWTLLKKLELPGAWLAAALFAVHPVPIASVAWIAQQKVLWCAAFYLSALLLYFRYCGISPEIPRAVDDYRTFVPQLPQSRALLYGLAMLSLMLALASQALAVTFVPVVIVAMWWERARITRRDLRALIIPAILTTIAAVGFVIIEWRHGAQGAGFPSTAGRIQLIGHVMWFDLLKVLAPLRMSYVYPRWNLHAGAIWQYLPTLAAIAVMISLWQLRRKLGRGPFAAAALFAILVLPYAGIINFRWMQQSYVGDHMIYLACAIPVIAIATILSQLRISPIVRHAIASLAIVVVLAAGFAHARDYRDEKSLWTATLASNPRFAAAHNALGAIAAEEGKTSDAFRHFTTALDIDDKNVETHLHLARLYDSTGQTELAVGEYYQVLRLKPEHVDGNFGLAMNLALQGDSRAAIRKYQEVLAFQPDHTKTYLNLGELHENRNEFKDAIKCYRRAIEIDPRHAQARLRLGLLAFRLGELNEAAEQFKFVVEKIDPRNYVAYFNLAAITGTIGSDRAMQDPTQKKRWYAQSAEYFRVATAIDPKSADAFHQRGIVLMKQSQLEPRDRALALISEAIASFKRAADLRPGFAQAIQLAESAQIERERRQDLRDEPPSTSPAR